MGTIAELRRVFRAAEKTCPEAAPLTRGVLAWSDALLLALHADRLKAENDRALAELLRETPAAASTLESH